VIAYENWLIFFTFGEATDKSLVSWFFSHASRTASATLSSHVSVRDKKNFLSKAQFL